MALPKLDPSSISDGELGCGCITSFILTVVIVYLVVTVGHRPFSILLVIGVWCIAFAGFGLLLRIRYALRYGNRPTEEDEDKDNGGNGNNNGENGNDDGHDLPHDPHDFFGIN